MARKTPPEKNAPADAQPAGTLEEVGFPWLLHELYTRRATGLLHLEKGEIKKVVYLQNGYPIFARSNRVSECLGQLLVREGRISSAQCDQSRTLARESRRLQGTVLVEMGLLTPHELHQALARQVTEKLLEVFAWTHGRYRFMPAARFRKEVTAIELSPASLILHGIRRYWSPSRLRLFLKPHLDSYLAPAENPHDRFQSIELAGQEEEFFDLLRGGHTLSQVLESHPLRRFEVEQLLAALLVSRMIEPVAHPRDSQESSDEPASLSEGALRAALIADYGRMMSLDDFELLGLTPDCGDEQVRRAYFRLAKKYHPDRFAQASLSPDLREKVNRLFQRLSTAYDKLSTLEGRQACRSGAHGDGSAVSAAEDALQAEVAYSKGQVLLKSGRFAQALEYLRPAVRLCPDEPEYLSACAWAVYKSAPQEPASVMEAREMLLRSADLNPMLDRTHLWMGYILRSEGQITEAERRFELAVMCNPDCTEALRELRLSKMRRTEAAAGKNSLLARFFRR